MIVLFVLSLPWITSVPVLLVSPTVNFADPAVICIVALSSATTISLPPPRIILDVLEIVVVAPLAIFTMTVF